MKDGNEAGYRSPQTKPGDVWYFAYGSNLDQDRKDERTEAIRESHGCRLDGYRLAFNKLSLNQGWCANIVEAPGDYVLGACYLCDEKAMAKLDGYEGPDYRRVSIKAVGIDTADTFDAVAYIASATLGERRPRDKYLNRIEKGFAEHHFPPEYQARIDQHCENLPPEA